MYHSVLFARPLGVAPRVSFFVNVDVFFFAVAVSLTTTIFDTGLLFCFLRTSSPCPRLVVRSRGKRAAISRAPNADDSGSKLFNTVEGIIGQKIRDNFPTMSPSETDSVMENDGRALTSW